MENKFTLMKEVIGCMKEAIELDSDDSDKDDILIGLVDLCKRAADIPYKRKSPRVWVNPCRESRLENGSLAFLTKELRADDAPSYISFTGLNKTNFDILLSLIKQDIERTDTLMREAIPPAVKLAVTLRFLTTGESFSSIDSHSHLSTSSICSMIPKVCRAISKRLNAVYLKVPSSTLEWEEVAKDFAIKWHFPNCIGALSRKYIQFPASRKHKVLKGTNNIMLMALVDANYKFIYLDIGRMGSKTDTEFFLESPLKNMLEDEKDLPPNAVVGAGRSVPFTIITDGAFPMEKHIVKPYPYDSQDHEKQIFNARFSHTMHVVAHAFEMLSNKFKVFQAKLNVKPETVEIIAFACCALHNFLLDVDDMYIYSCEYTTYNNNDNGDDAADYEAEYIRQELMSYFNCEGKLDWINI